MAKLCRLFATKRDDLVRDTLVSVTRKAPAERGLGAHDPQRPSQRNLGCLIRSYGGLERGFLA
jgi:hypothetical protein